MPIVEVRRLVAVGLAAALMAISLGGCGTSDSGSKTVATSVGAASTPAGERKPGTITVEVSAMKFSPTDLTVKVGDTVTWLFRDRVPHTVQGIGDKAMGINSPIIQKGEWSYTFTLPGTYRYLCSLHPEMRGTVTVQ
ncbi:cupredoxin domain-containing protein [Nocardia panacis]|nr:cupredoxin family copper-binding protein [Nocardia panacis]